MIIQTIYRYEIEPHKFAIVMEEPNISHVQLYRLMADSNKILFKDDIETACVDTDSAEGWGEKEYVIEN